MPDNEARPNLLRYSSAGVEFILLFGVMVGAGVLLDRRMDTLPGWTVTGAVVGFFAALRRLVKQAREIRRRVGVMEEDTDRPDSS